MTHSHAHRPAIVGGSQRTTVSHFNNVRKLSSPSPVMRPNCGATCVAWMREVYQPALSAYLLRSPLQSKTCRDSSRQEEANHFTRQCADLLTCDDPRETGVMLGKRDAGQTALHRVMICYSDANKALAGRNLKQLLRREHPIRQSAYLPHDGLR